MQREVIRLTDVQKSSFMYIRQAIFPRPRLTYFVIFLSLHLTERSTAPNYKYTPCMTNWVTGHLDHSNFTYLKFEDIYQFLAIEVLNKSNLLP